MTNNRRPSKGGKSAGGARGGAAGDAGGASGRPGGASGAGGGARGGARGAGGASVRAGGTGGAGGAGGGARGGARGAGGASGAGGGAGRGSGARPAKGSTIEAMMRARARQTRQRVLIVGGVVVLLAALAVAVALIINQSPKAAPPAGVATGSNQPTGGASPDPGAGTGAGAVQPPGVLAEGGMLMGQDLVPGGPAPAADEAVTVEVISDFLCPWCGLLEQLQGQSLAAKARAGEIRLVIHPVNNTLLDPLNDGYSWRSVLAADTVAALEPERFWDFQEALWENQPAETETSVDLTDQAIAELAAQVGVSQATIDQLVESPAEEWTRWSSQQGLLNAGGTPTVLMSFAGSDPEVWNQWALSGVDETGQEGFAPGDLDKAIANVKAGKKPDAE